ncbi:NADPH-dependent F420 reductase [Paraburkholderia sp. SIMBA_054]|uniref:NADPH-dependent F420 reductase n=1 Tax=Paraburkholderia sp. SIMBA_054 TaxID=3085795 RepID=UPI00397B16A2
MKIGILGSGRMGGNLGTMFARVGHQVTFSYSRSEQKLVQLVRDAGDSACSGNPRDAVQDADLVLLAVHWLNIDEVLSSAGSLAGKTVISCCNPLNAGDTQLTIGHTCSGAEVLSQKIPDAHVVAAFQTVPSEALMPVFERRSESLRPSLIFCGNDSNSKSVASDLIVQVGFDPVDAGPLQIARYIEPFGMLAGVLAYETDEGPAWAYRVGRFGRLFCQPK